MRGRTGSIKIHTWCQYRTPPTYPPACSCGRFCGDLFCLRCCSDRIRGLRACSKCYNASPETEQWARGSAALGRRRSITIATGGVGGGGGGSDSDRSRDVQQATRRSSPGLSSRTRPGRVTVPRAAQTSQVHEAGRVGVGDAGAAESTGRERCIASSPKARGRSRTRTFIEELWSNGRSSGTSAGRAQPLAQVESSVASPDQAVALVDELGFFRRGKGKASADRRAGHGSRQPAGLGIWTMLPSEPSAAALAKSKLCWSVAGVVAPTGDRDELWYAALGAGAIERAHRPNTLAYYTAMATSGGIDPQTMDQIRKDVPRTFADSHPKFNPKSEGNRLDM